MEIYTIGFTQKSAKQFFGILKDNGIKRLIDIRISNVSQLAGFTKKDDLEFFLKEICDADYIHMPILAPTEEIMHSYRRKEIDWDEFEKQFKKLLNERKVDKEVDKKIFKERAVLLCSEPTADKCHRRLVAEYLRDKWGGVEIIHL
jgi:uncharacterized protein (DUF488 family)